MDDTQISTTLMDFFKTFSNLERLKITSFIIDESLTPGQVAERSQLSIREVMNHLAMLTHLGYAKKTGESYQIDKEAWRALSRQVLENARPRSKTEDFEGEDFERKVLKDFFKPDGQLISIPSQQKKLRIVLSSMVKAFEVGTRYPEKQVNEMLKRYYPDPASLRRYLVDEGMLSRQEGVYWRPE